MQEVDKSILSFPRSSHDYVEIIFDSLEVIVSILERTILIGTVPRGERVSPLQHDKLSGLI